MDRTLSPEGVDSGLSAAELEAAQRRVHPRIAAPAVVISGDWCSVQDISLGGICLHQKAPLEAGEIYTLVLTDLMLGDSVALEAEVVWYRSGRMGLRWVGLEESHKKWLGKHSDDWHEESLLAAEAKNLAELVNSDSILTDFAPSRPPFWEAPDLEEAEDPFQPQPDDVDLRPDPDDLSYLPLQTAAPASRSGAGWSGWALRQLPRATGVLLLGLVVGVGLHRLAPPAPPLLSGPVASQPERPPFSGTWEFLKQGRTAFRETYAPDGAWRRELLWPAAPPQTGRWSEKDGTLTVISLARAAGTRGPALVRTERWWAVDEEGETLTLARLREDGTVAGIAELKQERDGR